MPDTKYSLRECEMPCASLRSHAARTIRPRPNVNGTTSCGCRLIYRVSGLLCNVAAIVSNDAVLILQNQPFRSGRIAALAPFRSFPKRRQDSRQASPSRCFPIRLEATVHIGHVVERGVRVTRLHVVRTYLGAYLPSHTNVIKKTRNAIRVFSSTYLSPDF